MRGVNKVILMGTVGKNPEVHYIENGQVYARFPLATDDIYYNKDQQQIKSTEWHQIVLWRKQAEMAEQYIHKGMKIYLEGRIRYRVWNDSQGNQHSRTEIHGTSVILIDKQKNNQEKEELITQNFDTKIEEKDNLPF